MNKAKEETSTIKCCSIWDSTFPEDFWGFRSDLLLSQSDFDTYDFAETNIIFVLVELKWGNKKRTDYYGFQIAKELRKNKEVLCPIVFCSFIQSLDYNLYPDAKILDTPGHYLLQLPSKPIKLSDYKSIDEDLLNDINMHIFNPVGALHSLIHDLENSCDTLALTIQNKENLSKEITELTEKKLKGFGKFILDEKKVNFSLLIKTFITELNQEISENTSLTKSNRIREIFDKYKNQIYFMLPEALSDKADTIFQKKRWSILFVDDEEPTCAKLKKMFDERGISCFTANNADDAFKILTDDEGKEKKIAVIISDFRLYEGGPEGKWQTLQGYQILKTVHEESEIYKSHYTYSILTSKKGTILDKIKHRSAFPVLWFYKADVLSNEAAFNIFYQRICEAGSEAFFRKHNIPNTAIWQRGIPGRIDYGYYYYYKQHIESSDHDEVERRINDQAINNINQVKFKNELLDSFDYQISLLMKKKKGKSEVSDNSFDLIDKFRDNILVVRRIYWGISVFLKKDITEIFKILKKESSESMMKAIINTSLGISFNADPSNKIPSSLIRYGLLDEEIKFLEQYAKEFEVDVSFIRLMSDDIDILPSFFYPLIGLYDIPEISVIYNKLDENKKITFEQFNACVKKILRKKDESTESSYKYRVATELFYNDYIEALSDKVKTKLLMLKHW